MEIKRWVLQVFLNLVNQFLIFSIREIHFSRIHLEGTAKIGTALILGSQMEMQVRQLVAIGTIVNLHRVEGFLHSASHTCHVCHKGVAVGIAQLVQVVHVVFVGYEATAMIGLLLK